SREVDEVSAENALKLVEYFKAHARRVYPRLRASLVDELHSDAEAVLEWIARNRDKIEAAQDTKPAKAFSWRMVRRDLSRRFDHRDECLRKALAFLEAHGYLREVEKARQGTVGRNPKPDYFVNEHVLRDALTKLTKLTK